MNSDSAKKRGRNGNRLLEKGGEIENVGLVSERKQYLIVLYQRVRAQVRQIEEENENKIKSETTKISIISPKTQNHVATLLTNFSSSSQSR